MSQAHICHSLDVLCWSCVVVEDLRCHLRRLHLDEEHVGGFVSVGWRLNLNFAVITVLQCHVSAAECSAAFSISVVVSVGLGLNLYWCR